MKRRSMILGSTQLGLLSTLHWSAPAFFSSSLYKAWGEPASAAPRAIPSPDQIAWQDLELGMFVHFAPNTWQDVESDNLSTPLSQIDPKKLDTDQWAKTALGLGREVHRLRSQAPGRILHVANGDHRLQHSQHTLARRPRRCAGGCLRLLPQTRPQAGRLCLSARRSLRRKNRRHLQDARAAGPLQRNVSATTHRSVLTLWRAGRSLVRWIHRHASKRSAGEVSAARHGLSGPCGNHPLGRQRGWLRAQSLLERHRPRRREDRHRDLSEQRPRRRCLDAQRGRCFDTSSQLVLEHEERAQSAHSQQLLSVYYRSVGRGAQLLLNIPANRDGLLSGS